MICVVCSVHVISTYYARKGSLYFYLNYPQINDSRKSDPRWQLILRVPHKMNPNYRSRRVEFKKKLSELASSQLGPVLIQAYNVNRL